jgi:Ser/Thr protein kinase RdoA (MazF antagonist)
MVFKGWEKEKFIVKSQNLIDLIESKDGKDDFDVLALEDLKFRQNLIASNSLTLESLNFQNDHLIHGDYYHQNVFFDVGGNVSHVFDFEKVAYAPRVFELIRSLMFMFFEEGDSILNTTQAKLYLKSYSDIYPISNDILRNGFKLYYLRMLHGFWVQDEHYLKNNHRVDQFLKKKWLSINYLSENLEKLESELL